MLQPAALGPKMYIGLTALGQQMYECLQALKYLVVFRADSSLSKNGPRAGCYLK